MSAAETGRCAPVAPCVAVDVAVAAWSKSLERATCCGVAVEQGGSTSLLLDRVVARIKRHAALQPGHAETIALWIMHAHCLDAADNNPRLHLRSPVHGSGKTTVTELIHLLTGPQSEMASHCTPAAFFRLVELRRKAGRSLTILLDEADQFIAADRKDALAILNSGHSRAGAKVLRCDGDNFEPKAFSTWAAVVIASIGSLPPTLESRSLIIDVLRKRADEPTQRIRPRDRDACKDLARELAALSKRLGKALGEAEPEMPPGLFNRNLDNWRPLIAIADAAGGHWPQTARQIARKVSGTIEDPSESVMLLLDIRNIFAALDPRMEGRISSDTLVMKLTADEERPWCEHDRGKPITKNQLARMLSEHGIRPAVLRIDGKTPRGYRAEQFADAFARYLPGVPAVVPPSGQALTPCQTATPQQTAQIKRLREAATAT